MLFFHLNASLKHYYTKKAFRKTIRRGLLASSSIRLYYSFLVSSYPAKMPLAFEPD